MQLQPLAVRRSLTLTHSATRKPTSILSRLSDRTIRRNKTAEQQSPDQRGAAPANNPALARPRATSFISPRSAQKRDYAAEKWFTDVIDFDNTVNRSDAVETPLRKKHTWSHSPRQHEMRPTTDLEGLFSTSSVCSAASSRLQAKKELGGDYASYLPEGLADPYQLPVDYARLALGRNKHISLHAQVSALDVIQEAIRGRPARQAI